MAIDFDGTGDRLEFSGSPISDYPLTMACWFKPDVQNATDSLMTINDFATGNERHELHIAGAVAGDPVRYQCNDGAGSVFAATTTGFNNTSWQHACAVGRSATSRDVYLNGGGKGSNTTSRSPTGMDRMRLGDGTGEYAGLLAEAAVWNVDLSDAEVARLAKGVSPLSVRPQNIVNYWPLVRSPYNDWVGGFNMTIFGNPTVTGHPPKIGWNPWWRIGGSRKIVVPGPPSTAKLLMLLGVGS